MHPNRITASNVWPILLHGFILTFGGASAVEGLQSRGLLRLVYYTLTSGFGPESP